MARLRLIAGSRSRGSPLLGADPVQDVPSQQPLWDGRVVEVIAAVAAHAKAFHHAARALVAGGGERNHLGKVQLLEGESKRRRRRFGGVSVAPIGVVKPPPDLDGGHEVSLQTRSIQPHEANEGRAVTDLDGPQSPPFAVDGRVRMPYEDTALRASERRREVTHHLRIRIHRRERREVTVAPLSELQALRRELGHDR
jgi:hypothetical protein